VSTTWLVDETYVKILGKWHYLYRGVDGNGQVLDCWLSRTLDLAAAEAFFRRTISSTGCMPDHVVTDKASFYPSAIRTCAPGAKHTATGFYNLVISTNRCERNHGYVKSRIRPMRGLKSFDCATRLFPALDAVQLVERDFRAGATGRSAMHQWTQLYRGSTTPTRVETIDPHQVVDHRRDRAEVVAQLRSTCAKNERWTPPLLGNPEFCVVDADPPLAQPADGTRRQRVRQHETLG